MLHTPVYLDNAATTRVDPRVLETMLPFFSEHYGNAASNTHLYGWEARDAVDEARQQVAKLIGAGENEIVFTSGATESDNLAIKGVYEQLKAKGNHIITCVTEHKAVLDTCKHLEQLGASVTYLPVDNKGRISVEELESVITAKTILISIMMVNNETGVLQPIKDISAIAHKHDVLFFTDATQAIGKIPVDVNEYGIDLMAFTAHKMYGSKGVGALYVRRKPEVVKIIAQMDGGGHEKGYRSGTLNVPGIVGFGKACELCRQERDKEAERLKPLRDKLEKHLLEIPGIHLNGSPEHRLFSICNISVDFTEGQPLMVALSKYLALSSGSACTSVSQEPSFVLKAMGLPDQLARSAFRFSLGRFTREEEIDYAVEKFVEMAGRAIVGR